MNTLRLQILRQHEGYLRILTSYFNGHKLLASMSSFITTSVDTLDSYNNEVLQRPKYNEPQNIPMINIYRYSADSKHKNVSELTQEELDNQFHQLALKNKDKHIEKLITDCLNAKKQISDKSLKLLLKQYSNIGKPEIIALIQSYCAKLLPMVLQRNGYFLPYLAKAQCLKGNSEKGLEIMKESFLKTQNIHGFHRIIFKELILDTVQNRSEASLVIFKRYVLEFSREWGEHYPLVCLWHTCWLSSWYSDQVLADELWNTSNELQNLICEKITSVSISALWTEYNEDAIIRLLQMLLKYKMMESYTDVLQVLFDYKLKNRDTRGCTEILRNCEVLGISLPSNQQNRYIKMLINGKETETKPQSKPSKSFKLKF